MAKAKKRIKNQKPYRAKKWDAKIFKTEEPKEATDIQKSDDENDKSK